MLGISTLLSTVVALTVALLLGPLLARLSMYWLSGRSLTHLLIEVRGLLLPAIATPVFAQALHLSVSLSIGLAVGISQGVAIARWGTRLSGDLSPTLLNMLAGGRSKASWLAENAIARGAVISTLAATVVEVVLVEGVMTLAQLPHLIPERSLGAQLVQGSAASVPFIIVAATSAVFLTETLVSLLLQRRVRSRD